MDAITRVMNDISLDGFFPEETGDSTSGRGWAGLWLGNLERGVAADILGVNDADLQDLDESDWDVLEHMAGGILTEDLNGFIDFAWYYEMDVLTSEWEAVVDDLNYDYEEEEN